jgi:glycosyltransferase involved in cell wall biosynthesis
VSAVAVRQAAGLARSFDVTLISDSHPPEPIDRVQYFYISPPSLRWLRRYSHVPREILFTRYARRALFGLARERDLAFVLCHSHAVAALAAEPVKSSLGVPYGLVTHGDIFDRPVGTYDARLTWFYKSVTPKAYRGADLIVALSPYMQALAQRGGAAKGAIRVIPNGVDPKDFGLDGGYTLPPADAGTPLLRILFVGRLSVEKGVDILLQACKRLRSGNVPIQLRIVGDGPLRIELRAMAATLGLDSSLSFVGQLPRQALGDEYVHSDVVCVPSRSDPFPTVILEAMASGRPVIGTNVGGISFAVEHEKTGLLVAPEAPDELAHAFERAAKDQKSLQLMGHRGHKESLKRFAWSRVTRQLADAIDATISR